MLSPVAEAGSLPAPFRSEAFAEDLDAEVESGGGFPLRAAWLVVLPVTLALLGTFGLLISQPV